MNIVTPTYYGSIVKGLLKNDFFTYRDALPGILSQLGWQYEDGIWEMPSKTEPEYAINLKIQTGDVSIINEAGTGMKPDSVLKEFDDYFKKLAAEMFQLAMAAEELVLVEEDV